MTEVPIDLDGRRTAAGQRETEMRRRPANRPSCPATAVQPHLEGLEDQMLAGPARTWIDVNRRWRFLLDRFPATPEAGDVRIQKLIKRALGGTERLRKRGKRK